MNRETFARVEPKELLASIVIEKFPLTFGVPVIEPLLVFSDNPEGIPEISVKEVALLAETPSEYDSPCVALPRLVSVNIGGPKVVKLPGGESGRR